MKTKNKKTIRSGQKQSGWAGKGIYGTVWQPELNPKNLRKDVMRQPKP